MQKWHAKSLYKLKVTVSEVTERKKKKGWQKFEVLRKWQKRRTKSESDNDVI